MPRKTTSGPVPGTGTPGGKQGRGAISDAARALSAATAELRKALAEQLGETSAEVATSIVGSLQEAARALDSAAARVAPSEKARKTRQDLLDAAAGVFAAKGYEGASVGEIAEAAGFTKGALYAHFPSKEQLFVELARSFGTSAVAATETADTGGQTFISWFISRLEASIDADDAVVGALLSAEFGAFGLRYPQYREEFARIEHAILRATAARLSFDRTGKRVPVDQDPPREDMVRAMGFLALCDSMLVHYRLGVQGVDTASFATLAQRL